MKRLYSCNVWAISLYPKHLEAFHLLFSNWDKTTRLSKKIKRFSILRSPVGNKKAKDHFERREYRRFFSVQTDSVEEILYIVYLLKNLKKISCKIQVTRHLDK